jgi:hypothetical protein
LGGVRLISSASTRFANTGPWMKRIARFPVVASSSMMSVPVMSLGIRSGRELDAIELEVEQSREARDQQRLGQARNADQQHMAVGEERGEELIDHLILADDHLAKLAQEFAPGHV